jgi:hypothetical protein
MPKIDPYFVQWAGQHYVAYELNRRGYIATLTFGNATQTDILAKSPIGVVFDVEVKSMSGPNFWRVNKRPSNPKTIWFFVTTNMELEKPVVSIMTGSEVQKEWDDYFNGWLKRHPEDSGEDDGSNFIAYKQIKHYENHWETLPK